MSGNSSWLDTAQSLAGLFGMGSGSSGAPGSVPDFKSLIDSKGAWYGGSALLGAVAGFWMSNGALSSATIGAALGPALMYFVQNITGSLSGDVKNQFNSQSGATAHKAPAPATPALPAPPPP